MGETLEVVEGIKSKLAEFNTEPLLRPLGYVRGPRGRYLGKPLSVARVAIFEQANQCDLPSEYKQFVTRVGDGGIGPGYGLCQLSTWRTVELPASLAGISLSDGNHQALRIVEHGGTDFTALVLSGSYSGRVVDLTTGGRLNVRPEPSFLDWYLNWLTVAAADLEIGVPRVENALVEATVNSSVDQDRVRALFELGALPTLADATVRLVERAALNDPSSRVRYQAIELLGELEICSMDVFLAALRDLKRSVSRRALVQVLRLAGDTSAWKDALRIVRSTADAVSIQLAGELESRRSLGVVIPPDIRG